MYHLKLPGFKCFLEAELEKATNDNDHRKIHVIHNILSAYVTPWVDFDLFYEQRS